jgi:DNA processing protein
MTGPLGAPSAAGGAHASGAAVARAPGNGPEPDPPGSDLSERHAQAVLTTVEGLGPATLGGLVNAFGSACEVLRLASSPGGVGTLSSTPLEPGRGLTEELAATVADAANRAAAVVAGIEAAGVELVTVDDPSYPERLLAIELPPHVLFVRGSPASMSSSRAVAVVGTRRATESGRLIAARIGAAMTRAGATVISGLATGIDGSAQAAVVAEGGVTVGVLGSGHTEFFPRAHRRLADRIVELGGAIVSEFAPATHPNRGTFPRRNRTISGLSDATVVVEAGVQSGALLTANWALEQGRECFFVPGSIDSPTAAGCLAYLREYAGQVRIVAGVPELVEDLGLVDTAWRRRHGVSHPLTAAVLVELGETPRAVAAQLAAASATADELVARTGLPIAAVLAALTLLEARGLVVGVYGRYRPVGALAAMQSGKRSNPPPRGVR